MKFQIKQKILSLTDSFDIQDERGATVYQAKGKLFSISSSQTLYNLQGDALLQIKRKYLSLLPACRILNADGTEWLIRKKFWPFWRSEFSVSTPHGELLITGNVWQHEYQIEQKNQRLASISKAWLSWSDSYGIEIHQPKWTVQLLAAVIVIDRIQHSGRNSTVSDD